jgi:hypothetical protein
MEVSHLRVFASVSRWGFVHRNSLVASIRSGDAVFWAILSCEVAVDRFGYRLARLKDVCIGYKVKRSIQ